MDLEALRRVLATSRPPFRLTAYGRVASTQDLVFSAARAGAAEGLVVIAEEQLAGRGRSGRTWSAPRGSSLLLSLLLRPRRPLLEWPSLSLVAGLALAEALTEVGGPAVQLKWPNDCLCRERKLAGVLAETRQFAGEEVLALGIGCNLSFSGVELAPELVGAATACDLEGAPLERLELAAAFLPRLAGRYLEWGRGGFAALRESWLEHAAWLGEEVLALGPEGPLRGRVSDVSAAGSLVIEVGGAMVEVVAGELRSLRRSIGSGTGS